MGDDSITISHGLTESHYLAAAEIMYDAFDRKMGPVFGDRERGIAVLAVSLHPAHLLAAWRGDELAGIAGFKYAGNCFQNPRLGHFVQAYGLPAGLPRFLLLALIDWPAPPGRFLLDTLAVTAAARGQGVGTRLLQATFDFARRRDFDSVWLDVVDTNPRAYQLYLRHGFRPVRTQRHPILGPLMDFHSATTMVKPL